jgi:hypothetical protein
MFGEALKTAYTNADHKPVAGDLKYSLARKKTATRVAKL